MFNCTTEQNSTTIRVLNISYLKETTNAENITGNFQATFNLWTSNPIQNISYSMIINDTKQFYVCITPNGTYTADAQFQYNSPGYDFRDYYLIDYPLLNNSQKIDLYLLEIALGTGITFTIQDESENPIEGYYIFVQRYDVGTGTYKLVAMGKSNELGQDLIYLRMNDAYYRFIVQDETTIKFISTNQKIISTDIPIIITPGSFGQILERFDNIEYTFYFNNATSTFELTYSGDIVDGCLRVIRRRLVGDVLICDVCGGPANTLTCVIDPNLPGDYVASFYSRINPTKLIDTIHFIKEIANGLRDKLKGEGALYTLIILSTLVFGALYSPLVAIILSLFIVIVFALMGILSISPAALIAMILIGVIIIAKMRGGNN